MKMNSFHYCGKILCFSALLITCGNAELYRNRQQSNRNANEDISFVQRNILEKLTDNPRFIYSAFMAKALENVDFITTQCLQDMEKIFGDFFAEVYPWQSR